MKFVRTGRIVGAWIILSAAGARASAPAAPASQGTAPPKGQPACHAVGSPVNFDAGSYQLDARARTTLDGVTAWLAEKEDRTLSLQGHAEITASADSNVVLSDKRATAVEDYLLKHGIDGSRIRLTSPSGSASASATGSPAVVTDERAVTLMGCEPSVAMESPPPAAAAAPVAAAAVAAGEPEPVAVAPAPPPPLVPVTPAPYHADTSASRAYGSPVGFAVELGGGYQDFTSDAVRNTTRAGGAWAARFVIGLHSIIGFEGSYIGAANQISPLGTSKSTYLESSGAQGAVRVNIPIIRSGMLIEPYGFAGLGWAHYWLSNTTVATTSDQAGADNVMTFPVGAGLAFAHRALLLDVRGSWTGAYFNTIVPGAGALNTWGFGGNIGAAF